METISTFINSEQLAAIIPLPAGLRNRNVKVVIIAQDEITPTQESPEGWFTPKDKELFQENHKQLKTELDSTPDNCIQNDLFQLLLNGPIANEDEIKMQNEIMEMRQKWTI